MHNDKREHLIFKSKAARNKEEHLDFQTKIKNKIKKIEMVTIMK